MFAWICRKPRRQVSCLNYSPHLGVVHDALCEAEGMWTHRNLSLPRNHPAVCATNVFIPWSQCDLGACSKKKPLTFCLLLTKSGFIFQELLWCSQALPNIKVCAILRAQRQLNHPIKMAGGYCLDQTVCVQFNSTSLSRRPWEKHGDHATSPSVQLHSTLNLDPACHRACKPLHTCIFLYIPTHTNAKLGLTFPTLLCPCIPL